MDVRITIVELFTPIPMAGSTVQSAGISRPPFRPYHPHLQPTLDIPTMADATDPQLAAELKKKRTFRTFSYRGIELDKLLDLSNEEVGTLTTPLILILTDPALFAAR